MSNRINIIRGTTKHLAIDLVDDDGVPYDLTRLVGASAEFLLRVQPTDVSNVLRYTTADTPTRLAFAVDAAVLDLTFQGADTADLPIAFYFYQVQITLANGDIFDVVPWNILDLNLGGSATSTPPVFDNTVKIDENFRLSNDLAYVSPAGSPIANAQVRVYLKSDYDAGNLAAPIGVTTTDAFGGWVDPILVKPGFTYVARFEKPNEWGPDAKEFFA